MLHQIVLFPFALAMSQTTQREKYNNVNLFTLLLNKIKNIAIFTISTEGIIISWNPGARHLFGYPGHEVIGKPMSFLFPTLKNSNKLHKDLQTALDMGQYTHETTVETKYGEKLWVNCVITSLWDKNKRLQGFSKVVEDITERKERDSKRSEYISFVGHELKNPLTSVKSYLQLLQLKMRKNQQDELIPFVDKANTQLNRLASLMDDLLDISKIDIGVLQYHDEDHVDVDSFLAEIVELLQPTSPNRKIVIKGKVKASLLVDKTRFEQVVNNLLLNAIKYSPEDTNIIIHPSVTKEHVKIGIQDFGIGISKDDQEKIFQQFQRLPEAKKLSTGLGLGLYLASEIIYHYKGQIWVTSKKGKGATFYFTLPKNQNVKKQI